MVHGVAESDSTERLNNNCIEHSSTISSSPEANIKACYFLCLLFMYYLCEKSYKLIIVQYYIADCVSWAPRLTLLDLTNKLDLWSQSWNRALSYVGDLGYLDECIHLPCLNLHHLLKLKSFFSKHSSKVYASYPKVLIRVFSMKHLPWNLKSAFFSCLLISSFRLLQLRTESPDAAPMEPHRPVCVGGRAVHELSTSPGCLFLEFPGSQCLHV